MTHVQAKSSKLHFPLHDSESAPEPSKGLLAKLTERLGFAPNVARTMAESPVVLESYLQLNNLFMTKSTFNSHEQNLLFLVISRENRCEYCVAAHSRNASHMKLPEEIIEAIRNNTELPDTKLNILAKTTGKLVKSRGFISNETTLQFIDAGYSKAQLLEIILAIGIKLVSNYSNHITEPDLDKAFESRKWTATDLITTQ